MVRIAMLSKWHVHAPGYSGEAMQNPNSEIVAVWDEDKARGEAWANELGVKFYGDLDELLAQDDIDAVICDAPTTAHAEILLKAAKAGKHIFTEKALCPTVAECLPIKEEIEKNNLVFTISYPYLTMGVVNFAKTAIENNAFGRVNYVRVRAGHNGISANWLPKYWYIKEDTAGGAMIDTGCHPIYMLAYLCDSEPKRITSIMNSPLGSEIDENGSATVEFENGIIGVCESSLITSAMPLVIEVYGTEGSLICVGDDIKFTSPALKPYINGTVKPTLPKPTEGAFNRFIDAIENKKPSPKNIDIDSAIMLSKILEGAYKSDAENKTIVY